ncbi:recombinase RecA [Haloterrigena sp. H1]|uniref:RAD55 family ATPase n=1 Tax=Haloterrigena sp. H1 TaxID=2552943 RepID=UPI00110D3C1F|nr:ATPase domain-containing protein [Haloterrigena sp. H1]TMT87548.1 recombinase RecA [Haloterrigena sp. H1]
MSDQRWTERTAEYPLECEHCHYPIPGEPVASDDGRYCSVACREAANDTTLPDPQAYKRVVTGIEPIDSLVPNGIPADSFLLLSGDEGTRRAELGIELVWRALERGEPAVVVSLANPPTATLERFYQNGWNVLPALENDRLRIIDCYTHRLGDRDGFSAQRTEWPTFLGEAASDAIVEVRDPSDRSEVTHSLAGALDDLEMSETGLVTIDSLDELERVFQDRQVHEFVEEIRATVCKARFVPIVAAASRADEDDIPEAEYVFDGIIDLQLTDQRAPNTRHKQLAIRKLIGAQFLPQWIQYDHEPARGLFASSPNTGPGTQQGYEVGAEPSQPDRP